VNKTNHYSSEYMDLSILCECVCGFICWLTDVECKHYGSQVETQKLD